MKSLKFPVKTGGKMHPLLLLSPLKDFKGYRKLHNSDCSITSQQSGRREVRCFRHAPSMRVATSTILALVSIEAVAEWKLKRHNTWSNIPLTTDDAGTK